MLAAQEFMVQLHRDDQREIHEAAVHVLGPLQVKEPSGL
jgi:hypothetical protein